MNKLQFASCLLLLGFFILIELRRMLDDHITEKQANHHWIQKCLNGHPDAFPYQIKLDGRAGISSSIFPKKSSSENVTPPAGIQPQFIVNIPVVYSESVSSLLQDRIGVLANESYGVGASISRIRVKRHVAVVFGMNRFESIDPSVNRRFRRVVRKAPAIHQIVGRLFGFFWRPEWEERVSGQNFYLRKKAFCLLKALSEFDAEKVRQHLEAPSGKGYPALTSQIPFQWIRETIKTSSLTSHFMQMAQERAPDAPIYYVVMDSDFFSLRSQEGEGFFSRLEQIAIQQNAPSVMSLGYRLKNTELPLLRLGVRVDMAVRAAIASVIPYGAYFPEPGTAVIVKRRSNRAFLERISFVGSGRALETRRLIGSGRTRGLDEGVVYKPDGGVVTTTPERMKTKKARSFMTLSRKQLKQKRCLQAVRGTSQTHAHPKQWADNVYAGLDFSCARVTDATTPMMHIFSVFDPLSRMFTAARHTEKIFDEVMAAYNKPLSEAQKNLLATAKTRLLKLGMKQEMIDQVTEAARRSGQAIVNVIQEFMDAETT